MGKNRVKKRRKKTHKGYSDKSLYLSINMLKYRVDIPTGGNKYAIS